MTLRSKVDMMTPESADWSWVDSRTMTVVNDAASLYGRIHKVDVDDLTQEAALYIAARPRRRRDDKGLRGSVRTVARAMQVRLQAERQKVAPTEGIETW